MAMEFCLATHDGLPDQAIISVRAGGVRRQAPIARGAPLKFPRISMEENPVKIDILRPVSTAYLIVKPGETKYKVAFDGGDGMSCEVELRADQGGEAVKDEKPVAGNTKDAKDYLEEHKLVQFIQALLQTVIKDRPENPYEYMARHFLSGYAAGEKPAIQVTAPDAAPEPAAQEAIREVSGPINSIAPTPRDAGVNEGEEPQKVEPPPAAAEEKKDATTAEAPTAAAEEGPPPAAPEKQEAPPPEATEAQKEAPPAAPAPEETSKEPEPAATEEKKDDVQAETPAAAVEATTAETPSTEEKKEEPPPAPAKSDEAPAEQSTEAAPVQEEQKSPPPAAETKEEQAASTEDKKDEPAAPADDKKEEPAAPAEDKKRRAGGFR
jgi:hypothetical protein